jgi:Domain of unknown function (DUF4158)
VIGKLHSLTRRGFKASYSQDELVEHFHLDAQDRILLSGIRGDVNRNGAAVLLKSLLYLGYFPTDLNHDQADS